MKAPPLTSGHYNPRQDFVTGVRGRETTVRQLRVFLSHQVENGLCEELQKKKCRDSDDCLDYLDQKFPKSESFIDYFFTFWHIGVIKRNPN